MLEKYKKLNNADGEKAMLELLKKFEEKQTNMREFVKGDIIGQKNNKI